MFQSPNSVLNTYISSEPIRHRTTAAETRGTCEVSPVSVSGVPQELDRNLEPAPTVSPAYWHYLDAVEPREDTAHYYGAAIGDYP